MASPDQAAKEILLRLKSTEPPAWVASNPSLHQEARTALLHLFSTINPFSPKSPFEQLLIDGFDNEQIWQQMDLQSHHLIPGVRREVRRYDKNHNEISRFFREVNNTTGGEKSGSEEKVAGGTESENLDGFDDMDVDGFDEDEESEEEIGEEGKKGGIEDAEESGSDEGEGDEDDEEEEGKEGVGIEDGFLKIKELEEYLEEDEAREYGLEDAGKSSKKEMKAKRKDLDESSEEDGEDDEGEDDDQDDDDEEGDELGAFGADEDGEETDKLARYEDFFGAKKRKISKREPKLADESEELSTDNEDDDHDDGVAAKKKQNNLSTHEKELLDLKAKIEQMEKANLEPKAWTMQGEVTAAKRPKNSALEVDLDFEHNARPAPVITEEVTASLEELIRKRILEGHYDDVQKRPSLPTKAPREFKELDENKSKKGLAEIYEEEYAQKTNLVAAPLSFTDEQKKEAASLFKRLCLKLDSLSHFNFAPKPVIEDMSIQSNVPALAMEEIAPLAVSDAAMLAPEEVFAGKGDVKDEAELTQAERKRRRANKKRKYKAESTKRAARKASSSAMLKRSEGNED